MLKSTPVAAVLVLLLAGCTTPTMPTPHPTASVTSPAATNLPADQYYDSVTALRDTVVALGYSCDMWEQDNDVDLAIESGRCSSNDSFAIFKSSSEVAQMSDGYDQTAMDGSLAGVSGIFGKNWVVLLPSEDADKLAEALGGMRRDPPDTDDVLTSKYSADELSYAKAAEADMDDADDVDSTISDGHDMCKGLTKKKSAASRAFAILDTDSDYFLDEYVAAVKYLCPKHKDALKLAQSGFTDGEYVIASKTKDDKLRPGTYRTQKGIRDCYWVRLTKHGSIIANDFISYAPGGARVTIRSSDGGFQSDGCGTWLPAG